MTELLQNIEIHLLPSLNTDGYILKTRNNANDKVEWNVYCHCKLSVKLIRIWTEIFQTGSIWTEQIMMRDWRADRRKQLLWWTGSGGQSGTMSEIHFNYFSQNNFLLSASFHDGWTMVIFPWDDSPACTSTTNAVCSEDGVFYALAQAYAQNHRFMHTG